MTKQCLRCEEGPLLEDLAGMQTVILAEPTREPRSRKYMQLLMQAQEIDGGHGAPTRLIEVLDGTGRKDTVQRRVRRLDFSSIHFPLPV